MSAEQLVGRIAPRGTWCSLRIVRTTAESFAVRDDVLLPPNCTEDFGAMVTVVDGKEMGLAATSDLSEAGLYQAARVAREWAQASVGRGVLDFSAAPNNVKYRKLCFLYKMKHSCDFYPILKISCRFFFSRIL
ncbi:MAG: hypothetical protein HRU16_02975, partial [Planctomycetes bacterium]|nr:hypothetical protein [Planctomycetota bacterium]